MSIYAFECSNVDSNEYIHMQVVIQIVTIITFDMCIQMIATIQM